MNSTVRKDIRILVHVPFFSFPAAKNEVCCHSNNIIQCECTLNQLDCSQKIVLKKTSVRQD